MTSTRLYEKPKLVEATQTSSGVMLTYGSGRGSRLGKTSVLGLREAVKPDINASSTEMKCMVFLSDYQQRYALIPDGFFKNRSVISRRKQQSAFDQVSEFDRSGLSARRPLPGLPLTQNHRHHRRQWCDERRMWAAEWNEVVFPENSRICLQHHDGQIRVWRHRGERMLNSCVMNHHTGSAPGIIVWGSIRYHPCTPLVRIAGTLNSQCYISEVLEPVVLLYL
ncbi:transposable element Tcb1 transposase [Trichonephila clavipes]|nr:transposable element Tcb1 transposase [Trichonephila clavipes]